MCESREAWRLPQIRKTEAPQRVGQAELSLGRAQDQIGPVTGWGSVLRASPRAKAVGLTPSLADLVGTCIPLQRKLARTRMCKISY